MPDQTTTPDPTPAEDSSNVEVLDWAIQVAAKNGYVVLREPVYKAQLKQLHARRDAMSGLLRGMARRVGNHRLAFATLRQHMIRVAGKIQRERDEARAELARVRPVVDAARAWKVKRDQLGYPRPWSPAPGGSSIPEARALYDAVAGLDGDAAATPQPAAPASPRHTDEQYRAMQDIVIFQSEHIAAITAELDLSYEAETETVLAAIRALATPATDTTPGGDR